MQQTPAITRRCAFASSLPCRTLRHANSGAFASALSTAGSEFETIPLQSNDFRFAFLLPTGPHCREDKSPAAFGFAVAAMLCKARVRVLAAGDGWPAQCANRLLVAPPGAGKIHLACSIGLVPAESGCRVLFKRITHPVRSMRLARRDLALENLLARFDRCDLPILDDFAHVHENHAETSVLFEPTFPRCERRSLMIAANRPFGEWGEVLPDETTAMSTRDRLVHRALTLEMRIGSCPVEPP